MVHKDPAVNLFCDLSSKVDLLTPPQFRSVTSARCPPRFASFLPISHAVIDNLYYFNMLADSTR